MTISDLKEKKIISFDCNSIHKENGEFYISEAKVRYFNLDDGMEIYAYDPPDVRNAVIRKFMSSEGYEKWYVELHDPVDELDEKQTAWISIGAIDGICLGEELGKIEIIQRMVELGYGFDEIDKIVCMDNETKAKLRKAFNFNK